VLIVVGMLPESQDVQAYTVTTDGSGRTRLHRAWDAAVGGTSPVVTSGLVFVGAGGVLSALDARNGKVLWQSTNSGAGGTIGGVHWQSPIVVDGAVYMSDLSGNLTAYAVT
jgi:outer membrane protein assembly factor BamB